MITTSELYKSYIGLPNREFEAQAIIGGLVYGSDEVVEFTVEDMITGGDELTIGTVIPAKLSMKLKTASVISTNAKIVPEIRLNGSGGYTEWIPMGEFYIDARKYQNGVWSFECVDKLITTEQPYISSLTYPVSMASVFDEICTILGIDSDVVINPAFQIPYKDETISIREMLSCIASAHSANIKLNRAGELIFVPLTTSLPVATITASSYIRAEQTNPQKTYTKLQVVHNAEGEVLELGTGTDDNTLKFENRFMFLEQSQFSNAFSVVDGLSYVPFNMSWRGRPDLETGDAIKIVLLDTTEITSILAVNKISFKGGLLQQSSAPSKSEQQSEFKFQGSLTKQMAQRVVKDQVYNGASFGPGYGLKVERSDGKAHVLANAIEGISIYSNSGSGLERNFFVDTDGRIKAKNIDIEGSGTFGGNITAANVTMHNGSGTGSLNFNLGPDQYIVLKTAYTTNGNTLIIGKSGIVGGTPAKMERIDFMAGTLYVYDNLYVANNVTCLKINGVDSTEYLHSKNLTISDEIDHTTMSFFENETFRYNAPMETMYGLGNHDYSNANVTGVIPVMTQAEAAAKTDWLPNQLVIVIDGE
ncbi:hypothetical protein [Acetivibrio cellulolyticus]|uniref:hypothetical protein n=1 Tax=Acetivibrio cellulolyticus TaxID=35830 RepID=UPI0001E2D972|nr:hypothetical protein [Acetivibrio cellulolyticus]